jgi:cell division protein FtsN
MPKLGAPVDHTSGLRRSFFVLLVLILSSAFCIGLSAAAMAEETAAPAHEDETQVEPTPNDWHPEEQEETPEHPEDEPECNVEEQPEEPQGQTAAEDECESEEEPEEDSDDDSDEDSEEDSGDDECEIPGETDGGDDRADDDEDDEDCEVEAEEPEAEEPEEGDDTEVLGTTTVRPRLAQTAPGETSALALYALAFLGAGIVMRVAGNRRIAVPDTDKLLEQALRRNARYLARHR